jgi:hypothetical protein
MSRISLSRVKKLESISKRITSFRQLTDEQLLEAACGNDAATMASVMPAFRASGLDAGFEELYRVLFADDPEKLTLILDADRSDDYETVARVMEERYARAV